MSAKYRKYEKYFFVTIHKFYNAYNNVYSSNGNDVIVAMQLFLFDKFNRLSKIISNDRRCKFRNNQSPFYSERGYTVTSNSGSNNNTLVDFFIIAVTALNKLIVSCNTPSLFPALHCRYISVSNFFWQISDKSANLLE